MSRYTITFEVLPDPVPELLRVRALLKRAGRDLKMKCVALKCADKEAEHKTCVTEPTPEPGVNEQGLEQLRQLRRELEK